MQKPIPLNAESRNVVGKKVKQLRFQGKLPAILYGYKADNQALTIDAKEFRKAYNEAGSTGLIDLKIGDASPVKVLIHDTQEEAIYDDLLHVDLFAVNMEEKVTTEIPLEFVGESLAVEEHGGSFVAQKNEVEVEALPQDLVSEIQVDISVLKTFEDRISIGDLQVPAGIEILNDKEEVVAMVTEPRSEEELEEELKDTSAEEAAVIEKLGETPEPAEGEQAPAEESQQESKSE